MDVIVAEEIRIKACDYSTQKHFENLLTFANPDYYKKQAMGRWTGNTPEQVVLFEKDGNDLILPFGMLSEIFKMRSRFREIKNEIGERSAVDFRSRISLYEYQQTALNDAVRYRNGIIVAPCGAGKTMIGLQIAAEIGLRTLWLTHTQDLLNQSMERAKQVFDLDADDIGTITAGKVNLGKVITFATVQTACKINLEKYKNEFGCVIVDECHRVSGTPTKITMFSRVLSQICARYKFGLTATPKRSDGLTKCMFALIGEKIAEIEKSAVETTCPIQVEFVKTEYQPNYANILNYDGTINFADYISDVAQDEDRNKLIADVVSQKSGTILILTDRVSHEKELARILAHGRPGIAARCLSIEKKADRKQILDDFRLKKFKVLIATYALAKEGLDIPTLDVVVLATPQKNEGTVVQSVGRVGRKAIGKDHGTVIDFVDDCVLFDNMATKRRRIYAKNGWL